ncbi:cell division inhibition protein DicB [Escherichia coli]|uniref:cell division inhibition protein DicB n=1 Tax=Escherichia coli TaxID=562 RepID=UPI0015C9CC03|nr:cell division inhibition protein DicB [Escherichia coli]NYO97205.1 cell division inhibition protein DicB [Escherichia coli]
METLLPNVNTSEGCFEIGVTISNPVFTEDAINKRKHERELLNKICILSMLDWPPESPDNQYHLNK